MSEHSFTLHGVDNPGRRAPRMAPEARRAAIIEATLPLVRQHGTAVTTRQIADAAGVAEGTLFRVFPDKESLVRAAVAQAFDPGVSLRELAEIDRALPLRERLTAAVVVLQCRLSEVFGLLDALGWAGPPDRTRHPTPSGVNDAFRAAIVDLVGPDEAALRVPARELAHVLRLLVFAGTHPLISDARPLDAQQIVAILLDGLLAPPTTTEDS
jgi:AcrR family transcriptional regulator